MANIHFPPCLWRIVTSDMYWVEHFIIENFFIHTNTQTVYLWQAKIDDDLYIAVAQLPTRSLLQSSSSSSSSRVVSLCCSSVRNVLNWSRWHSWATHDASSCSLIMSLLCRWPVCFDSLAPTAVHLPVSTPPPLYLPPHHLCCTFFPVSPIFLLEPAYDK